MRVTRTWLAISALAAAVGTALLSLAGGAEAGAVKLGDLRFDHCIEDSGGAPDSCSPGVNGLGGPDVIEVGPERLSVYVGGDNDSSLVHLRRNPATGGLSASQCFDDDPSGTEPTCTPVESLVDPNAIEISPDGRSLYVAAVHEITHFRRNPATGALTPAGCIEEQSGAANCAQSAPVLASPEALEVAPDGRSLYVADSGTNALIHFSRNTSTGALSFAQCVDDDEDGADCPVTVQGLEAVRDLAVAPDGRHIYLVGGADMTLVRVRREASGNILGPGACLEDDFPLSETGCTSVPGLINVENLAISADGRSVYTQGYQLSLFRRNPSSGAVTFTQCFENDAGVDPSCSGLDGLDQGADLAISPDDRSLYTVSRAGPSIHGFDRDPATGALFFGQCFDDDDTGTSSCANVPGLGNVQVLAASGDGGSVYTAAFVDDAVAFFDREALRCRGRAGTVYGTSAGETLAGTAGADVLIALGGPDTTTLLGGNDVACGGAGSDRLMGGAGRDLLLGEGGADRLLGGKGPDRLVGGKGRDRLRGGPGRDKLRGGPGRDRQRQQ
jgi:6-phosphogluconolactonase (cycloisomerase 2 family)